MFFFDEDVKTNLRNRVEDVFLSASLVCYTENVIHTIHYDDVIECFMKMKTRRENNCNMYTLY